MANGTIDFQEDAAPSQSIDFQPEEAAAPPVPPVRQIRPPAIAPTAMMMGGGATALGAFVPPGTEPLREFGRMVSKPIIDLAPTPGQIVEGARNFAPIGVDYRKIAPPMTEEQVQKRMKESPAAAAVIGAGQALGDLDSFFTSPLGIATLATAGLGAIPAGIQRGVALGFSAQMASQTPSLARELGEELGKPEKDRDYNKISRLTVNALANTGFTVAGARHALAPRPGPTAPPLPPVEPAAVLGGAPIVQPGRRMVVPPPGMATLEQTRAFMEAGQPIRRPLEEVRVPPEAPQGQPTYPPSGLGRPEPPAFTPALEVPPTPPGQRPIGGIRMPPPPEEPPAPAGEPVPLPPKPPAGGPEIAFTPKESGGKDMLGNPLGTKYYSSEEDWAAWKQIQADKAIAREAGHPAAVALAFAKNEALKNKYGGSVPLPPKGQADPMVTMYHGEGGVGGAGTDTRFFTRDPQQAARYGPNITQVEIPESEVQAYEAARQAKGIGTPGAILPQEYVKRATPMANPPAAPVTEIEEPTSLQAEIEEQLRQGTAQAAKLIHEETGIPEEQAEALIMSDNPEQALKDLMKARGTTLSKSDIDDVLSLLDMMRPPDFESSKFAIESSFKPTALPAGEPQLTQAQRARLQGRVKRLSAEGVLGPPAKIAAAAYMPEGATVPETGPHHPGILKRLGITGFETPESRNTPQFGFVDENGVFHTREESAEIAKATGQDLKEFEEGEPAHSDEIESPTQPGVPISETKPPVAETKPPVPATKPAPAATPEPTAAELERHLKVEDPDITTQREAGKFASRQMDELRKQMDELDKKIKALEPKVKGSRGWNKGRIKASAKKADIKEYQDLNNQLREVSNQRFAIERASSGDREAVEAQGEIRTVNDPNRPLLQRLGARINLDARAGLTPPEAVTTAFNKLARDEVKKRYPDASEKELAELGNEVQRAARLRFDLDNEFRMNPALNSFYRRRQQALEQIAFGAMVPFEEFSKELSDRISKYSPLHRESGDYGKPVENLTHDELEKLRAAVAKETESIQANAAALEAKRLEEEAAEKAKEAELMKQAQAIADSAIRTGKKGGRSAAAVKEDLIARVKNALADLTKKSRVALKRDEEFKGETPSEERYVATHGDDSIQAVAWLTPEEGKFKVEAYRTSDMKEKFSATFDNRADAEWFIKGLAAEGPGKSIIGVPGDGVYAITNSGKNLLDTWQRAKSLDVTAGRSRAYVAGSKGEKPPGRPKTIAEWNAAKEYYGLEDTDKIAEFSPELKQLAESAEKKTGKAAATVTVKDVDTFLEEKAKEPPKGIVAGTDVEKWADSVIKKSGERLRSGLDPELAAAGVVKGVAFLERGLTEFAKWSAEMIKAFGEAIRPHLANLYEQAKEARAGAFRQSPAEPARKAETPSLPKGPQPPPSPPASPVQPEAAAAPQGEPTHGIAARVTAAAAQQGIIAPVEPGEGIAASESVEHGRQLLNQGANPQAVLDEFNRTKAVTADGMAVVRAQGERLRKAARDAANKFGITSDQYEAAWKADSDWTKAIKPLQTEWHKIGQAQQGEVEIDTGTFHGLRSAFFEATGKDFTPDQKAAAEKIAKGVKDAQDAADKAKDDAFKQIDKEAPKVEAKPVQAPTTRKRGPKQPPVAQPTTKQVWNRAKVIIDGGETDFDDVRHKLAIEFGLPVDEITRILAEPKAVRTVTDDMYRKMAERRRLVQQAKNWLKDQQVPGWYRFIRNIPRVFFIDKVFGHGTVGMITHAGLNMFNPPAWKTYWPNFLRQYKLLTDPGYHERMMQDLVRDPLFTRARRAGLANDPFRYQDDYQTPGMTAWLGRLGLAGNRGFDSLKLFRQARFNQIWNDLPTNLKNPVHAKLIADAVNHATGVVKTSFGGEWANWTFFAPKLEGSRWAWMIGDPVKAAATFIDWGDASPEAREFALSQLKEKAYIAGTYFGLLALNQGILAASGSKDQVNFTNPRRSDFLSFKAEGHNIGIVGPMLGMVRLFANMLHASTGKRGKVESLQSRADEMGATVADYARGKLSPFAGFGVDVASQADFQGRPLPFSSDRVPAYLRKQGIKKYTYGEYAAQEFTPIPVSEAVREVWRAQGMNEDQINRYLDALLVGVVAGGTGARISVATPQKK